MRIGSYPNSVNGFTIPFAMSTGRLGLLPSTNHKPLMHNDYELATISTSLHDRIVTFSIKVTAT